VRKASVNANATAAWSGLKKAAGKSKEKTKKMGKLGGKLGGKLLRRDGRDEDEANQL
jgi:hypothetical protein